MATDWIKMRCDLAGDPRVIRMAGLLAGATLPGMAAVVGIDEFGVVGRLHAVWSWGDVHARRADACPPNVRFPSGHSWDGRPVGVLHGVRLASIDRLVHCEGFGIAMAAVGWLIEFDDGLIIPDFDKHNGGGARQRALDAQRKKDVRRASASEPDRCPDAKRTRVRNVSGCDADESGTREEKRRVEKNRTDLPACATGESKSSGAGIRDQASGIRAEGMRAGGDPQAGRQGDKALGGWGMGWGDKGEPGTVREALRRLGMRNPALGALAHFAIANPELLTVQIIADEAATIRQVAIEEGIHSPVGLLAYRLAERLGISFGSDRGGGGLTTKQSARLAQLRMLAEGQRSASIETNGVHRRGRRDAEEGAGARMGGAA